MVASTQLHALERSVQNRPVLSVFVDLSAASEKQWRDEAYRVLGRLIGSRPADAADRTTLELCVAHIWALLESLRRKPVGRGWVAYATTDDVIAHGSTRIPLVTSAIWRTGAAMGPLLARRLPSPTISSFKPVDARAGE